MKDNGQKWRMMIHYMTSRVSPEHPSKNSSDEDQHYPPSSRMGKKREEKKRRANKRVLLNSLKDLLQYDTSRLRDTDILRLTITTIILSKYVEPYDNEILEDIEKHMHMKAFTPIFFHMIVDLSTGSFNEGKIIYICRFVDRVLDYKREEMLGHQVGHFLHTSFPQPVVLLPDIVYPNGSDIKPFKCIMKKKALTKNESDSEGVSLKISGFVFQRKNNCNASEAIHPACALMAEAHVFPEGFHSIVPLSEIHNDLFLLDCLNEGEVRSADHRISTCLGISPNTIRNTNILDYIKEEDKEQLKRVLKLANMWGFCKAVCRIKNGNGEYHPVECEASLQPNIRTPTQANMLIKVQMISQNTFDEQYQNQEEMLQNREQYASQEWVSTPVTPIWNEQTNAVCGNSVHMSYQPTQALSHPPSSGMLSFSQTISEAGVPMRTYDSGEPSTASDRTITPYQAFSLSSPSSSSSSSFLPPQPPQVFDPSQLYQPQSHSDLQQEFLPHLMPQAHQSTSFYSRVPAFHPYWHNRRQDYQTQDYANPYSFGRSSYP